MHLLDKGRLDVSLDQERTNRWCNKRPLTRFSAVIAREVGDSRPATEGSAYTDC